MACSNCKFFDSKENECRAHPPTVMEDADEWPMVKPTDWCGEYQSKNSSLNSFGNPQE